MYATPVIIVVLVLFCPPSEGDAATPEEYHSDSELSSAATTIDLAAAQFDKFHPKGRMVRHSV